MMLEQLQLTRTFVASTSMEVLQRFGVEYFAARVQEDMDTVLPLLLDLVRQGLVRLWYEYRCANDNCNRVQPERLSAERLTASPPYECPYCGYISAHPFDISDDSDYELMFGFILGAIPAIIESWPDQAREEQGTFSLLVPPPPMPPAGKTLTSREAVDKLKRLFDQAHMYGNRQEAKETLARLRELGRPRALVVAQECSKKWPGLE